MKGTRTRHEIDIDIDWGLLQQSVFEKSISSRRRMGKTAKLCFLCLSTCVLLSINAIFVSTDVCSHAVAFAWPVAWLAKKQELRTVYYGHTSTKSLKYMSYRFQNVPNSMQLNGSGADIEQPLIGESDSLLSSSTTGLASSSPLPVSESVLKKTESRSGDSPTGDIPLVSAAALAARNKVNEIDFCIAPADVSLSKAYGRVGSTQTSASNKIGVELSLTRALNNASNRAVRRILLARSWPSAEALNLSLRQVAMAESKKREKEQQSNSSGLSSVQASSAKCPVPRPILNVLTRQQQQYSASPRQQPQQQQQQAVSSKARSRTDQEYVADQIQSFRERYGSLPGFQYAEDYLASILSLATSGLESERAVSVIESGYYDEAYKRVLAVLQTVGVQFLIDENTGRQKIAPKLLDQDICLSILDKIQMKQQKQLQSIELSNPDIVCSSDDVEASNSEVTIPERLEGDDAEDQASPAMTSPVEGGNTFSVERSKSRFKFWNRPKEVNGATPSANDSSDDSDAPKDMKITADDLGGVLLSAKEPTMTRQLNVLANIVQRALLFGGDQELLVLAETLDADKAAFIERWYPSGTSSSGDLVPTNGPETRPGVQFLDSLIQLLRTCYTDGVVTNLNPAVLLTDSYANGYERLVASAVELGSGYMKPFVATSVNLVSPTFPSSSYNTSNPSGQGITKGFRQQKTILPKPRTAKEGIGQFAIWESLARQKQRENDDSVTASSASAAYPSDMVGTWEVRDEVGGKKIGSSTVTLLKNGYVSVPPPLEGLRWRLDPGPTHLDTCTFQVLSPDGAIIQYRGFIDRGARLEARFSKRPLKVRGSVMFQMRDGAAPVDFYRDMLPINYRQGTTKFIMRRQTTSSSTN